jgi:hypothetical protein
MPEAAKAGTNANPKAFSGSLVDARKQHKTTQVTF